MSTENQIALISNPQEFTRLYNSILRAKYGDDFLSIDDDRADDGNDGYLKSQRKIFAGHCFKRVQNQSIDAEIRKKMTSDLRKAIALRDSGAWPVDSWTFICNYSIFHEIARDTYTLGRESGIEVSWMGPGDLADLLQAYPHLVRRFPLLSINQLEQKLTELIKSSHVRDGAPYSNLDADYTSPSEEEISSIIQSKSDFWQYMLLAKLMQKDRAILTGRLLDHEMGYARRSGVQLDEGQALSHINGALDDAARIFKNVNIVLAPGILRKALGDSERPGSVARISHVASRVVGIVEELLAWSTKLRGFNVPANYVDLYEAAARFVDRPIVSVLEYIDEFDDLTQSLPEREKQGETGTISSTLVLATDHEALERFLAAVLRIKESESIDTPS